VICLNINIHEMTSKKQTAMDLLDLNRHSSLTPSIKDSIKQDIELLMMINNRVGSDEDKTLCKH
jgi:hypothetical protein